MKDIYKFRWPLLGAFFLSLLFTLPFIINNNYFIDDWLRSDNGNSGWEGNGRPLASILMSSLSLFPKGNQFFGDGVLFDIFPLTLIVSSAILVLAAYIFCIAMDVNNKIKILLICSIPVCNPYWIGNIEFRHDSLIMATSFFLAILSSYVLTKGLKWVPISILFLVCSLSLYQTSLNAYISMSVCIILQHTLANKIFNLKLPILYFLTLLLGYLIYSQVVISLSNFSEYAISNSKIINFSLKGLLDIIINFNRYFDFIIVNSPLPYLWLSIILALTAILCSFLHHGLSTKFIICTITLIICLIMSFGVLSLFERPAIASRTMMPISLFFMLCIIFINGKLFKLGIFITSLSIIISFCFSYIISSAINNVERQDRFIAMHIASIYAKEKTSNIYITGKPSFTKYASRVIDELPMAKYMVISAFNNYRFKYSLMAQYGVNSIAPELKDAKKYDMIANSEKPNYEDKIVKMFITENSIIFKIK